MRPCQGRLARCHGWTTRARPNIQAGTSRRPAILRLDAHYEGVGGAPRASRSAKRWSTSLGHGVGEVAPASPNVVHAASSEWTALLHDAAICGIGSKERLLFEADVGHMHDLGSRLTDRAPHRQSIPLWHILLRAQALQHGHDGIKRIWTGLHVRSTAVRFDDDDEPQLNALWRIFLSAGGEDLAFLRSLCAVAQRLQFRRPNLFLEIVGAALDGNPATRREAIRFADMLKSRHYRGRDDLLALFDLACRSRHDPATAVKEFVKIYATLPATNIYGEATARLWAQGRSADAFFLHAILVRHGDLPARFECLEPFIRHLVRESKPLKPFLGALNQAGVSFDAQVLRCWSREKSRVTGFAAESLNVVASNTLGVAPKKLSDDFIARAFATRAVSFDFAVNSMRLIGLIEVGPLAIRQMALSSPDLDTLRARFQKLKDLEIDTGSSAFVRILRRVCDAGRWGIIQALVDNDLHHEVFEDTTVQLRLLKEYYRARDWTQINRTLVILNQGSFDDRAQAYSTALLMRCMIEHGDWHDAVNLATDATHRGVKVSAGVGHTITHVFRTTRDDLFAHGKDLDRVGYLVGMLQNLLSCGTAVPVNAWRRALRAMGTLGRLKELESLVYWLARFYSPRGLQSQALHVQTPQAGSLLADLFDHNFQKALVSWCFRPHRGTTLLSPEGCLRWTRVLKTLRDVYGVDINARAVESAFVARLRYLFAPGIDARFHNLRARSLNAAPASRYWHLYDLMWDMKPAGAAGNAHREEMTVQHSGSKRLHKRWKRRKRLPELAPRLQSGPGQEQSGEMRQDADDLQDIVVYRDLFHASPIDYRR